MNKIEFYFKYIFKTASGNYINWRFFLPLLGVALGVITVTLTFAIMQGMESEVFNKLESINFVSVIVDDNFIKPTNSNYIYGIDKKAIIKSEDEYRVINIRALEDIEHFKEHSLKEYFLKSIDYNKEDQIVIGNGLAGKLGVSVDDTIELISPTDVSFLTGIPTSVMVKITGIFNIQLLNYDNQYVYTSLSIGQHLFKNENKKIYSNLSHLQIQNDNPEVKKIISWRDEHSNFIAAMSLEKLAFSSFGFLIIILSAFSSFSIMCITVMRRISEIGILRTLGFTKKMIANIYIIQSLLIGLIGGLIGVVISKILIHIDKSYNIISNYFSSEMMFNFKLNISNQNIFLIFSIGIIIMLFAGIYPALYASKISITNSINYNK